MERRFRVFIPEPEWEESHRLLEEIAEVEVGKPDVRYTEELMAEKLRDVDAVIITSQHHITRKVLESASRLKVIAKYGAKPGMDNVDMEAATEKGIVVCYTPEANSDSVAEHTIALMLALLKRVVQSCLLLRQGKWREGQPLGFELIGKTVGIIGFGSIGRRVAERLKCFGVHIMTYDPYVSKDVSERLGVKLVDLETLLSNADIVTIHAALSGETYRMIGEKELRMMKRNAFLINTARGAIVDEKALVSALRNRWIAGAALDVFEEEPPSPDNPLLQMDNVIVTPHSASRTLEAYRREAFMVAEEVYRVLKGIPPRYVANPEVLRKLGQM